MIVGAAPRELVPTLIVPDEQTWTMLGHDPATIGAEPSFRSATTAALLVPTRIPAQLKGAIVDHLPELSGTEPVRRRELELHGSLDTGELIERARADAEGAEPRHGVDHEGDAHGGHGRRDPDSGGAGHDHHGHGDMMAIVGEPSADGLVMESIEVSYGPLATPFPGGLTVEATLDGEVVSDVTVSGLLEPMPTSTVAPPIPDPLAPKAWAIAIERALGESGEGGHSAVFVVELERAVSHLVWLRALARLLGWKRMLQRTAAALAELTAIDLESSAATGATHEIHARLDAGSAEISRLAALLSNSRALRWRLTGRGIVARERAEELDLHGPNARASGLARDGRIDDPAYTALGFEPLLASDGDAAARTLLRAREAGQSVGLARAAPTSAGENPTTDMIEGPRGGLRAHRDAGGWSREALGAAGARALATGGMVGETWAGSLVVLASFDLSPWEIAR